MAAQTEIAQGQQGELEGVKRDLDSFKAECTAKTLAHRDARLETAMRFFDSDGSGVLSMDEFHQVGLLLNCDSEWTYGDSEAAFHLIDTSNNGSICLAEFCSFYQSALANVNDEMFEQTIGRCTD